MQQLRPERTPTQQGFDWRRQWYPVAVLRDLEAMDPRQPYPVKVWSTLVDGLELSPSTLSRMVLTVPMTSMYIAVEVWDR